MKSKGSFWNYPEKHYSHPHQDWMHVEIHDFVHQQAHKQAHQHTPGDPIHH